MSDFPPPPPPNPYAQPYWPQPLPDHPQGTTVLVLGILGIAVCGVVSPVAWIMGNRVLAEIDASPGRYGNRDQVQAGRICGMVVSLFMLLGIVVGMVAVTALVFVGTSTN